MIIEHCKDHFHIRMDKFECFDVFYEIITNKGRSPSNHLPLRYDRTIMKKAAKVTTFCRTLEEKSLSCSR